MKSAVFGAVFSAIFFSGVGAHAQDAGGFLAPHQIPEDTGVFDRFLNERAPECVPVSAFSSVSTVTELSPAQFEFVRAIYVALPPVSHTLPPGDHAVLAESGSLAMLALVSDGQACARFLAPDFILSMLHDVGSRRVVHIGQPVAFQRDPDEGRGAGREYRF